MHTQTRKKAFKGTVSVEEFQGRLRLRWRFESKRYTLSIGLPDSKVNRKATLGYLTSFFPHREEGGSVVAPSLPKICTHFREGIKAYRDWED